jgi:arylsulfatase
MMKPNRPQQGATRRAFLGSLAAPALASNRKPDIVYITSDQQRRDELSCSGNPLAHTPNLDRLGREGAVFRHAFVQFPVCLPSRVSMLTGRYPHAHRVGSNSAKLPVGETILPELLRSQGYSLGATGVLESELARHFDECDQTPAFRPKPAPELTQMDRMARSAVFSAAPERHWDARCLRAAQRMLRTFPHPQFLSINFHQPHGIIAPLAEFAKKYDPANMRLPASYETGPAGRPAPFLRGYKERGYGDLTKLEVQTILARRLASVEMLDSFIGELRRTHEELGTAENTIVIYQSDHGDYGGEFGCVDKSPTSLTDALLRVPMILWAPGRAHAQRPVDLLVEEVDVLPTILELAGLPLPQSVQGRSLLPLVQGKVETLHDAIFAETGEGFTSRMIRTPDWKLVVSRPNKSELYDLRQDPGETRNVFGAHPEVAQDLEARLRLWDACTRASR